MKEQLPQRFTSKFSVADSGCWEWTAASSHLGYGAVYHNGRQQGAHRAVYELLVGEIPNGLELDHLCRNPKCVNPEHLEPVTHRENIRRGSGPFQDRARQTHCKHGHPFDQENTRIRPNGTRKCRECERRLTRETQARRRAKA